MIIASPQTCATVLLLPGGVYLLTRVYFEDVSLARDGQGFTVSERLKADAGYVRVVATSDLKAILQRFAESAQHRMRHLEGHPEKTQSKIRGH